MADRAVDVLIVGAGVAGASCAATLRAEGFEGSILLVGRELDPPYHRPPATKGYLQDRETREDALFRPSGFWAEQGIELVTRTSALGLDLEARKAKLQGKHEVAFTHAVIATGAMVRRLPLPGAELDGIHYIRTLGNTDAIRADLGHAGSVLLLGGSFIGCEVAASLTALGHSCTLVMQEEVTLERTVGRIMGRRVQAELEARGVEVVPAAVVERFEGEARVERAVLADGRALPADVVVIGSGAIPDVALARRAGLEIGPLGGVRCDATLAASAPGVWAVGDLCEFESVLTGGPVRIEHEDVAVAQGRTAARNLLGAGEPHAAVPYFWSDLADWLRLECVGAPDGWDAEEERGPTVFHLRGGRVVGAATTGGPGEVERARLLVADRAPPA